MDIDYLLLLQNFRNGVGSFLAPFLMWASEFAISFWPIAMLCMLYWVLDRKGGKKLLLCFALGNIVNGFLKLTFCVYRPWIRDARILPYGDSKVTATGYSFPSGHSTMATSCFGGIGYWLKKHGQKVLTIIFWLLVLCVLFARNYLGVHTPQDVIVGFGATLLMMFLASKIESWTDKDIKRDKIFLIVGIIICIALVLYYELKPYPLAYLEDGSLLVDPNKMKGDSYQGIGLISSYVICRYFERRGFDFEGKMDYRDRFIIGTFALIPLYIWMVNISPLLLNLISRSVGYFIEYFVFFIYTLIIVPNVMKYFYNKDSSRNK